MTHAATRKRRNSDPMAPTPGTIRIDTVQQGNWDQYKGGYHTNSGDESTQFEAMGTIEKISMYFLILALEQPRFLAA